MICEFSELLEFTWYPNSMMMTEQLKIALFCSAFFSPITTESVVKVLLYLF